MNTFKERFKEYRSKENLTLKEFGNLLGVSESYASMIEKGRRAPSKSIIYKLVTISDLPPEFWEYGISATNYVETRKLTKSLKEVMEYVQESLSESEMDELFSTFKSANRIENLFIAALKSDLSYISEKKSKQD